MLNSEDAEQNYWSERGRAASVGNTDMLGRPRRSVLTLGRWYPYVNATQDTTLGVIYENEIHIHQ